MSAAIAPEVSDHLVALAAEVAAADQAHSAAYERLITAEEAIGYSRPSNIVEVQTAHGACHWTEDEIREAARPDCPHCWTVLPRERDRALAELAERKRHSDEMIRALGLKPLFDAETEALRKFEALMDTFIGTPAETVADFAVKVRRLAVEFEDTCETQWAYPLLQSVVQDAERFTGGES